MFASPTGYVPDFFTVLMLKIRKVFREEMTRGIIDYVHIVLLDTWSFYEHNKNTIRF